MIALAVMLSGCDLDDSSNVQPVPVSYVAVYNAIPDAPELDLTVDNRLFMPRAFRFGDNTYYQNFYTGERNFQVTPYGASNVIADTTLTLADGGAYSLFFADEYSKAKILVTNDSAALAEEGKVKVRLINLSPDASPVSLRLRDDANALVENKAFTQASAFVVMEPKSYDFEIVSSTGEAPIVVQDVDLQAGDVRTLVVRGYRNPPAGNTNGISVEIVVN